MVIPLPLSPASAACRKGMATMAPDVDPAMGSAGGQDGPPAGASQPEARAPGRGKEAALAARRREREEEEEERRRREQQQQEERGEQSEGGATGIKCQACKRSKVREGVGWSSLCARPVP